MNWTICFVIAIAIAFIFLPRFIGQISTKDALAYLQNGALLIDVRSPGEFSSGHLPGAINLPLDEIETLLPRCIKDKEQVLLLHCHSGMRSGMTKRKLRVMGYANAFNLGSYARASRLLHGR
jgi:rhodanese-related sulfurtransferase